MTNNYEENILKGVKDSSYSLESSLELLQKDVVQLHAPRYQSMRRVSVGTQSGFDIVSWRFSCCQLYCNHNGVSCRLRSLAISCLTGVSKSVQDVIGCTQEMDFILWPRNDIEKIVCLLFSRWKGAEHEPFRPVQVCIFNFCQKKVVLAAYFLYLRISSLSD